MGAILVARSTGQYLSKDQAKMQGKSLSYVNWTKQSIFMFQQNQITLHCYQSGVSVSTNVFEVYMLQVNRLITIPYNSLSISHD